MNNTGIEYGLFPKGTPQWFTKGLAELDSDKGGLVEQAEFEYWMHQVRKIKMAKENNSAELDYTTFPPVVQEAMRAWDTDGGGTVSVGELTAAANAQKKLEQDNQNMKKFIVFLVPQILYTTNMEMYTSVGLPT